VPNEPTTALFLSHPSSGLDRRDEAGTACTPSGDSEDGARLSEGESGTDDEIGHLEPGDSVVLLRRERRRRTRAHQRSDRSRSSKHQHSSSYSLADDANTALLQERRPSLSDTEEERRERRTRHDTLLPSSPDGDGDVDPVHSECSSETIGGVVSLDTTVPHNAGRTSRSLETTHTASQSLTIPQGEVSRNVRLASAQHSKPRPARDSLGCGDTTSASALSGREPSQRAAGLAAPVTGTSKRASQTLSSPPPSPPPAVDPLLRSLAGATALSGGEGVLPVALFLAEKLNAVRDVDLIAKLFLPTLSLAHPASSQPAPRASSRPPSGSFASSPPLSLVTLSTRSGTLAKRSDVLHSFRYRFVLLVGNVLLWYKSDDESTLLGSLFLTERASVQRSVPEEKDTEDRFCFSVTTPERTLVLGTRNAEDRRRWCEALENRLPWWAELFAVRPQPYQTLADSVEPGFDTLARDLSQQLGKRRSAPTINTTLSSHHHHHHHQQQQQQQQHSHQRTPSLGHSKSSTVTFSDAFPTSSAHSSTTSSTRSRPVSSSVLASSTRSTTTGSSSTAPVPAACHVSFSPAYASSPAASDEESSARLRLSSEEQHELNVALWEAVSTGNADETARLVESGADVMYIDESGADLLLTAARHNNAEITALLLQSGPEVQRLAGRALALATDEEVRTLLTDCMDYYMEKEQHEQELEREAVLAVAELDESDMASSGGSKAIGFAKTSETHPMQVDFVKSSLVLPGRLGMCMCPGRNKPKKGFRWARDATSDVIRIRDVYRGEVVVSLVRDQEKARMGISDLTTIIEEQGLQSISCPITDKWIPSSMDMLCELVIQIMGLLRNGRSVIIHCNGGKGRTGMVVVAVLLAMGLPSIRDAISVCRSSSNGMLKNPAQQFYLRYFKKVWYKKRRTASVRELMEQNKKVHRSDKDFFKERSSGTLAREKSRGRFAFVKRPSMVVLRRSSRAGLTESAPAMRSSAEALSSSGKESCSVNVDSADNTVPCTLSSTSVGSVTGSDEFDDDESPSSGSEEE